MELEQMRVILDKKEKTQEEMLAIAKSYLRGDVLCDCLAAEAWLHAVMDAGETVCAAEAMGLLAKEILKKDKVLTDLDRISIEKELETEKNAQRRAYLSALLKL